MIRAGIAGADTAMSGELIRILLNHPDVELISAFAPGKVGRKVSSIHHGLAGECDLEFSQDINPGQLDVIFIDAHSEVADRFRMNTDRWPELKIIDMSHCPTLDFETLDMTYGLPELNRKKMVRGCKRAVVPRSLAAVSIIGLYPLAKHLLLKGDIKVEYSCPADIDTDEKIEMARLEIRKALSETQNSFTGDVKMERSGEEVSERGLKVSISLPCSLDMEELLKIYSDMYEDHNFTFIVSRIMPGYEVEGTQKTLITLQKHSADTLTVTVIGDCRMRGGAGDAVHIMNLLFGLQEKTGLHLKAYKF